MVEHVRNGRSLRDLGAEFGLSHEGARKAIRRAAIAHVAHLTASMWACQATGDVLTFMVPPGSEAEQDALVRYAQWVIGEMTRLDLRVAITYSPAGYEGGFVLALEDLDWPGGER